MASHLKFQFRLIQEVVITIAVATQMSEIEERLMICSQAPFIKYLRFRFWRPDGDALIEDWVLSNFPANWPDEGPPAPEAVRADVLKRLWDTSDPAIWAQVPGISIPIRGTAGTASLFCVAFQDEATQSPMIIREWISLLQHLAREVHTRASAILHQSDGRNPLSVREKQCISLASIGKKSKEIAHELHISASAENTYLAKARVKLKSASTLQAAVRAAEMGYLPIIHRFQIRNPDHP